MTSEQVLLDACREWHRLAKAAHTAICRRDWKFLLECQCRTKKIHRFVSNLARKKRDDRKEQEGLAPPTQKQIHDLARELVALLESNSRLLQMAKEAALVEREKLAQSGRNLKRLQNSYASGAPPAWTSVS